MAGYLKIIFLCHSCTESGNPFTMKFNQSIARLAIEMVVLRVTIVMFIDIPAAQRHFFEQAGFVQLGQSTIDSGPRNLPPGNQIFQMLQQFFRVEMIVMAEHLLDDQTPLHGQTFAPTSQKFTEPLQR